MSKSRSMDGAIDDAGIQVYLRIRPSSNSLTYFQRDEIDLKTVSVKVPKNEDSIVNNSRTGYNFSFSGILDDKANQRDVFRTVGVPAIQNALAGFNSTIFAYGQTGSGKTYTVTGGPERYEDRGIIPRAIAHLFKTIKDDEQKGISYSCLITYLEIYNQSGYDLLMESNHSSNNPSYDEAKRVTMLEDEYGDFHFKNLSMHTVTTEEEALNLLFHGDTNRVIAATEMNQNSTRSHCIFTIVLEKRTAGADIVTRSKLNIVDLAGSERVSRTSSTGQTLREAKYINSSLFFLEMVIVALQEKSDRKNENVHVPYRNSMMTSVLRDSLGGNCKTIMVANISPEAQYTDESISTCHFAQRVALIKNSASVNEKVDPELVIQSLRAEVKRLREEVDFLSGKNDDDEASCDGGKQSSKLSQEQMNELLESILKYVQNPDTNSYLDFCGGITLPRIHAACSIFKDIILGAAFGKSPSREATIDDDRDSADGDVELSEKNGQSFTKYKMNDERGAKFGSRDVSVMHRFNAERIVSPQNDIIKSRSSTVCGVPICRDKRTVDEPNLAFEWFQERYPGRDSIDELKNTLKMKYSEAKKAGARIEEIRSKISRHKEALEHMWKHEAKSYDEELVHNNAIDREKTAYKETLEQLSGLKGSIENIQQKLEKGRLKLQSDFDTWYQQVGCYEENRRGEADESPPMTSKQKESTQIMEVPSFSLTVDDPKQKIAVLQQQPTTAENKYEFKLPDGIMLTGNPEADSDIIAFYKAKEVLLSKMKRK